MLLRSLFACALVSASVSWSKPAWAQISFGTATSGTLEASGTLLDTLTSTTPVNLTVIVGSATAGANLQITPPVLTSGPSPDPSGTVHFSSALVNGILITSNLGDTATLVVGTASIEVDMEVQRPLPFPAGSYSYQVEVLVTPN